ncbi:class I SAM-dependent methyltransferase [Nesterenkonia ebinurensis]|uniref:class I SAM-dependent methyltransferase n=1 Tax=Nesterenkonia ebinurensis TaxID=2608252 RepID=UPI001CC533AA|nr:methyltransferase [Nesterenkonia ebinurensis]
MGSTADADWAEYYRRVKDRPPRPLVVRAAEISDQPGTAVDLGCGDGTETVFLLERGWAVTAVDLEPAALELTSQRAGESAALSTEAADLAAYQPAQADLILASASLPFVAPEFFTGLWERLRGALSARGLLAVHLFGDQDSWAQGESAVAGMTFHTRSEVEALLTGFEVLQLQEQEFDGPSGRGPKHWHRFDIIARNNRGQN